MYANIIDLLSNWLYTYILIGGSALWQGRFLSMSFFRKIYKLYGFIKFPKML